MRCARLALLGVCSLATAAPALAQIVPKPDISIELDSDQRRRGLSWSDGRPAVEGFVSLPVGDALTIGVGATSLRGSARHGGADVGIDGLVRVGQDVGGGWRLSAGVVGHVFPGEGGLSYVELEGAASYQIGPAMLGLTALYAPAQSAIGGDNLYLQAGADIGIPGSGFTLHASVGRSSGAIDDPVRAARLRPENRYWDYAVGVDRPIGPFTVGVRYTDTSIDGAMPAAPYQDRHVGARLVGFARLDL